jgi:hypothetical protein
MGGVEQGFGGDAADIQAGAAKGLAPLHHGDALAQLRGADGADIAAGAGADDDGVEICHGLVPCVGEPGVSHPRTPVGYFCQNERGQRRAAMIMVSVAPNPTAQMSERQGVRPSQ